MNETLGFHLSVVCSTKKRSTVGCIIRGFPIDNDAIIQIHVLSFLALTRNIRSECWLNLCHEGLYPLQFIYKSVFI